VSWRVVVCDFGLSRTLRDESVAKTDVGNVKYRAPERLVEQLADGGAYSWPSEVRRAAHCRCQSVLDLADPQAQVFAVGLLLFEIFTLTRAIQIKFVHERRANMQPELALLPTRIRPLLSRAVALDPGDRCSIEELCSGVAEYAREVLGTVPGLDGALVDRLIAERLEPEGTMSV
jgi:serine/threonine protein kinase